MLYLLFVIASIILFKNVISIHYIGIDIKISGSLIPYVFLYPLSFIILKLYGYRTVNNIILSMLVSALIFVVFCKIVIALPNDQPKSDAIKTILDSAYIMFLAGLVAMPAGIYASFLTLRLLEKINLGFNFLSLSIATAIGEIINSVIVFPIGYHGQYTMHTIFSTIIIDALIFKLISGIILAGCTIYVLNLIRKNYD